MRDQKNVTLKNLLKVIYTLKSEAEGMLSYVIKIHAFLGSGPNRGRSPVEWGDFPSVRPSIRTSVRPYVPPSRAQEPARQALDPASQASEPARQASEPARQASEPARQASEPASQASEPAS